MSNAQTKPPGTVYLVGAGPGNPSLLTLRAAECLRFADAVLYDSLVNPAVLEHAPSTAQLECVGKHGQSRIWPQDEINARMISLAAGGANVVRLKGGDPAVFARGAEEAEALANANLPFEIVPGVTAALAAGSYAGVPVTHRELASAVALVTGQEQDGKQQSSLDFAALAQFPGTLVFYMGVVSVERWSGELLSAGKPADTPCAIVRRCSLPDQLSFHCRLDEVADVIANETLRPPVIVIVGPVVECFPALSWFEQRPLFGRRVLITRPPHQARELAQQLSVLGAEVHFQPAIEICEPDDWGALDDSIRRLTEFDWLVFTSPNGVEFFFQRLHEVGKDARALSGARLAVVGPATAEKLREQRLHADLQPAAGKHSADHLADLLVETASPAASFLFVRGSRVRDVLPERLAAAGQLEQVVAYQSCDVAAPDESIAAQLREGRIDWCTVTSSAIARSLVSMFGESLRQTRLASISPLTSATLAELGFPAAVEARQASMASLAAAISASKGRRAR